MGHNTYRTTRAQELVYLIMALMCMTLSIFCKKASDSKKPPERQRDFNRAIDQIWMKKCHVTCYNNQAEIPVVLLGNVVCYNCIPHNTCKGHHLVLLSKSLSFD
jgi:hypothetical protein